MQIPKTLQQAVQHFSNYDNCKRFMVEIRWPDSKVRCPQCGSERVTYLERARRWKCYEKHGQPKFTLKTGTIFEDSPIGLDKWLPAAWLLTNCKNGISSYEISRDLGVTQKSAWFMMHRIRLAQQGKDGGKLSGEVEVDETFIGGKARFMHKDRKEHRRAGKKKAPGPEGKAIVAAVLERGGKVLAQVVGRRKKKELHALVKGNVEAGSALYSDDLRSYDGLDKEYEHQVVDHAVEYVRGNVHTNGLENFWSLLKRGLKGTYVSVEPFHLFRYVDEQAFRYNHRKDEDGDAGRFETVMSRIVGRRLTWDRLTGKELDHRPTLPN